MISKEMKKVKVIANKNASLRTKNRIREFGPIFFFSETVKSTNFDPGITYHGFSEINGKWWGWLKANEVTIEDID
jgi:hypothetical protein